MADTGNNRISVFNAQGAFLRAFGFDVIPGGGGGAEVCTTNCKAGISGDGAGQLADPGAIAVDAAGNLYVTDTTNNRIAVFNAQGTFLRAFGLDVIPGGGTDFETCTASCKAGVSGGAAGGLLQAGGVALDAAGDVYVADTFQDRISVYTSQGTFLRSFGFDVIPGGVIGFETCSASCKEGANGGGAGQLSAPTGLGFDGAGNLYVAETNNHRISVFSNQGTFLHAFGFDVIPGGGIGFEVCTTSCKQGAVGTGPGQLANPTGVAVDTAGSVYVAEIPNDRMSVFNAQGTFLRGFGFDVIPGGSAGFEACTVSCKVGVSGNGAGQLDSPGRVATDCRGAIYVADEGNHRIQRFGEPATALPPCPADPTPDPPPPPDDTTPPDTTSLKGPKKVEQGKKATFSFASTEAGSSFRCKLDKGKLEDCRSPRKVKTKKLDPGKHSFSVVATDAAGNADLTPAKLKFKVERKKRK